MEKKEYYRRELPHFQQPGQSYFVTWNLKDAVPAKALVNYKLQIIQLKQELEMAQFRKVQKETIAEINKKIYQARKKYMGAYDDLLDVQKKPKIDLSKPEITSTIADTLHFWEKNRIDNYAFCIMPNHVHWVLHVYEKDVNNKPVYLQDILHSIKSFTALKINEIENLKGAFWQDESFDTTIRDQQHLFRAIDYTIMNPVKAGLVDNWLAWKGTWCEF